jgi:hypothetical protein
MALEWDIIASIVRRGALLRTHFSSRCELERKFAAERQVRAEISAYAARLHRQWTRMLRRLGRALRAVVVRS